MENSEHTEAQQKVIKQSAIVFLLILVGPVCGGVIILLSIVIVSTHPLRGLHFLLPESLYLYLLFLLISVSCVVASFFEIRKSGYKIKKILSALFLDALIIFSLFYDPFNDPFLYVSAIAADRNNTLYIFNDSENQVLQINADIDLYRRHHVPNLEKLLDCSARPCVTDEGVFVFATSKKSIVTYDVSTEKRKRWKTDVISDILDICLDEDNGLVVVGCDSQDTKWMEQYQLDGTHLRTIPLDEQLPCRSQLCGITNGRLFFIDEDAQVHVLDNNGRQVNAWKLPDVRFPIVGFHWSYDYSVMDAAGILYFRITERGPLFKCDLDGNKLGTITLDVQKQRRFIASGPSKDIFVADYDDTVKQYDSDGNLRYTHGHLQWRHYWAFLRNLFRG